MAVLKRPGAEIHYEEYGQGFPILLFAPGGMRSRAEVWLRQVRTLLAKHTPGEPRARAA